MPTLDKEDCFCGKDDYNPEFSLTSRAEETQDLQRQWEEIAESNVAFMEANRHRTYGYDAGQDYDDRIVNGYVAFAQPWLASLAPVAHPNIVVCGGTLINARYIMWV